MKPTCMCHGIAAAGIGAAMLLAPTAQAADPIRIGVIAESSSISGAAIPNGAQMAADEINAAGGLNGQQIEIVTYDNHASASDSVRAFQRAANQDHVAAVIGSYISEVVLALEPWSGRLKLPFITPGAASNEISRRVHEDYDHLKYSFHGWLTSAALADSVCDAAKDILVDTMHVKTAVVFSEDAAWTLPLDTEYLQCLPKIGIKVLDHIRFSPDTTDFTPIFNDIETKKPDVIITGISHVGVQPTVQWQSQQVPIAMFGISSQATASTFWKDTNGAADGVIFQTAAAPGVAITPKSIPFTDAYTKRFNTTPAYCGYTAYDDVYMLVDAIKRAGSTDPDAMVAAMEKTDYVGTIGRYQFFGPKDEFTHALKSGKGYIAGVLVQWQDGKQKALWPAELAQTRPAFPKFIRLTVN